MVFNWKTVCFISHWHHLAEEGKKKRGVGPALGIGPRHRVFTKSSQEEYQRRSHAAALISTSSAENYLHCPV